MNIILSQNLRMIILRLIHEKRALDPYPCFQHLVFNLPTLVGSCLVLRKRWNPRFVSPDDRHYGREFNILANRRSVYEKARRRHPNR
ncbi:MAG: hypothetical protein FP816_01140 [Desulfobacteraceae bacterium]|nr:hypothetical protein [Desulfobacteraceae bacterium]